jgi:hypothetical protein
MRTWLTATVFGVVFSAGCAATPKQASRPMPRESDDNKVAVADTRSKEASGPVKVVARVPSSKQYKFVGRVEVRATNASFVDQAATANAELRQKAKALGADVVKLDVITPPSDRPGAHSGIILAGRAYKKAS